MIFRWFLIFIPFIAAIGLKMMWPQARKLFFVENIFVHGARRTNQKQILWAVGIKKDVALWDVSLGDLKKRFQELPWVKSLSVRRLWPESIQVHILEKEPLAVWICKGQKCVIDGEGGIIPKIKAKDFAHLILLKGDKAPLYFPQLLCLLDTHILHLGLKGAIFLPSQRWDLHFKNGLVLQLPHTHIVQTLERLEKNWPLLAKAKHVDARFSDAIMFQEA